jgi:hypothetical protein
MLSPSEIRKNAISFEREHTEDHDEKSQAQMFWRDFFAIFGLSPQRIGVFEARAKTLKGTVGFIDFFWPGTLLVEHKSRNKDLDAALGQALDYCTTGGLKDSELPRYIVVCDFARFILVELGKEERAEFSLDTLHDNLHRFNFILGYEQKTYKDEDPVNIAAAELMGTLHDELRRVGYEGHPLELFLVRLMFCFFADDTGIFQKDQFGDWMETRTREDGSDLGQSIAEVFRTLNTSPERRQRNLPDELAAFPYVNGELFAETIEVPYFDAASRAILLHAARFNWGSVSPAIFGSLFQSVMAANERRMLGAHYTSEKNILKTIHGLFLDKLHEDFESAKTKRNERSLKGLLERIAGIRLLDPACGCGNFLILAYRELRRLEIEIHKELRRLSGDIGRSLDLGLERGITVDHVYGIEISEFPSQIARVALWIMDHLMNVELAMTLGDYRPSIPLVTSPKIIQGNALRLDWNEIVKPEELSYILGNPPFVGKQHRDSEQVVDMDTVFAGVESSYGILDYVTAWYLKAARFIQGTTAKVAFVSTNSITQGEQVPALWGPLYSLHVHIDFAHRTFKWSNEARGNAAVFCVIIGFSVGGGSDKRLFDYIDVAGEPTSRSVKGISPYLASGDEIYVTSRTTSLCLCPPIAFGNMPNDDGNLLLANDEKIRYLQEDPSAEALIRPLMSAKEFLHGDKRWCLWLKEAGPTELRKHSWIMERVERVKAYRLASSRPATVKLAAFPTLFGEIRQPDSDYILIPRHSSEGRDYIPFGFFHASDIVHDSCLMISNAGLYHFGVLQSSMHMAWMRQVCGRLEGRYRYSNNIVYNNFPWPAGGQMKDIDASRIKTVEEAAQAVLDARLESKDSCLADLYDPLAMPQRLIRAHQALDLAVDKCYRKDAFKSELERVEYLFSLYEQFSLPLSGGAS